MNRGRIVSHVADLGHLHLINPGKGNLAYFSLNLPSTLLDVHQNNN